MDPTLRMALNWAGIGCGAVIAITLLLHSLKRLGAPGRALLAQCVKAPGLDVVVALLSWIPWVVAASIGGWPALAGTLAGQIAGLFLWIFAHESAHREAARGPRIVKSLNRAVGPFRNHLALWITAVAYPIFWVVRAGEILVYPLLTWTVGLPRYKQSDWVNVSRHKFSGLVGHDLIWCLYCDWMTGVYALGGEMLRNVESFWCPIRFYNGKKCENCKVDFPDIDGGWVPATATIADAAAKIDEMYGKETGGRREWFGHPARQRTVTVTVNGETVGAEGRH
jgi:hypothetical protein